MHFAPYSTVFCNQDKQVGEFLFPGHFAFDDNPLCDSTVNAAAHYNCIRFLLSTLQLTVLIMTVFSKMWCLTSFVKLKGQGW